MLINRICSDKQFKQSVQSLLNVQRSSAGLVSTEGEFHSVAVMMQTELSMLESMTILQLGARVNVTSASTLHYIGNAVMTVDY